jgi:hypothetical protein
MKKSTQIVCVFVRIQHNSKHLNHSETLTWSLEDGYSDSEMIDTFPRRALTSGTYGGLTLFIGVEDKDIEPICRSAIHSVQVSTSTVRKELSS